MPGNHRVNIVVDGMTFNSIKEACDHFGTPYKTYQSRIQHGRNQTDAITGRNLDDKRKQTKHPNHCFKITVDGITYPSIKAACAACGISYQTYNARVARLGYTPEQALSKSFDSKHNPHKKNGEYKK